MRRPRNTFGHPATLSGGQPPSYCDHSSVFHRTLHIVGEITRQSNGRKGSMRALRVVLAALSTNVWRSALPPLIVTATNVRSPPSIDLRSTRNERQLCSSGLDSVNDRNGEGFRVPSGVRKPLMQEPVGHSRWLWGFRCATDVGVGGTDAGKRRGGCGQAASLRLGAV